MVVPPGKKRSVRRTAPSLKLRAASVSPRSPITISVDPPPMSTNSARFSNTGTAWSTPRWISRASSSPEITSISTCASSLARRMKTSALAASRVALVATARRATTPWLSAIRRMRCRQAIARSIASGAISFMSVPPWPRRTTSFSRLTISKPSSPVRRATTMWKLLVPRSRAARTSFIR